MNNIIYGVMAAMLAALVAAGLYAKSVTEDLAVAEQNNKSLSAAVAGWKDRYDSQKKIADELDASLAEREAERARVSVVNMELRRQIEALKNDNPDVARYLNSSIPPHVIDLLRQYPVGSAAED